MPICPECEQLVSYQDLDVHQRYCSGSSSRRATASRSMDQVTPQLSTVRVQLEDRIEKLESKDELPTEITGVERSAYCDVWPPSS